MSLLALATRRKTRKEFEKIHSKEKARERTLKQLENEIQAHTHDEIIDAIPQPIPHPHEPKPHTHEESEITNLGHYDSEDFERDFKKTHPKTQTPHLHKPKKHGNEAHTIPYTKEDHQHKAEDITTRIRPSQIQFRGLNADTLDGKHAKDLLAEAKKLVKPPKVIYGGGGGEMKEHGNEHHNPDFATEIHTHLEADITDLDHNAQKIKAKQIDDSAIGDDKILVFKQASNTLVYEAKPSSGGDMYKSTYDIGDNGIVDNSEKLEGSTKAEVQDHSPKAHTHTESDITDLDHYDLNDLKSDHPTLTGTELHNPKAHTHVEVDITDLDHDAQKIKGKTVDDAAIADKKLLVYNATGAKLEYKTLQVITALTFAVTGTLSTGTDQAPTILAPCSLTIQKVKLVVKTAPTGASIIVDVNRNGTTIFTTQSNRPGIAAGQTTGDSGTPDVTSLSEGDKVTIDVDQVGSGTAGANLTAEVVCKQTVS